MTLSSSSTYGQMGNAMLPSGYRPHRLAKQRVKDVRYSKAWKMAHFAFDALPLQPYVRSALNYVSK